MERTAAEAAAIPVDGLSTEERITRDMLQVIGELRVEEDDQGLHQLRVVDQMGGPQQLLPQLTAFQPVDTPERLEAFIGRLHAYPAFMAANADILREALGSGPDRAVDRDRADHRPDRADAGDPDRRRRSSPASVQGASDADRERIRDIVRDVVYPADAAFLETLRGEYRHASREEPGIWSAPNGEADLPDRDPQLDDARDGPARDPPDRPRRARDDRGGAARDRPRGRVRRRHGRPTARRLDADAAGTRPQTKDELVERARRGHRARDGRRAALLRRAAAGRAATSARSRSTRRRTRPFAYYYPPAADGSRDGIYYANGYDLPSRKYTKLASTTYHEAAPGHHFQIALEMENPRLNTFRRLGRADGRRRLRRGLGPVQRAARRRDGAVSLGGRALRDARRARPGARRASSSTPGCTRCAGSASARSTSCATTPACPRPTP